MHSENLTKKKGSIVGVRSEDLLFLLESVHRGYLPAGQGTRFKEEGYFYLVPNPESTLLQGNRKDLIYNPKVQNAATALRTFPEMVDENISQYGNSAVLGAIHRNFFPLVQNWDGLVEKINKFYGESGLGLDIIQEKLLEGLAKIARQSKEIQRPIASFTPNNRYLFDLFHESVGHSIDRNSLQDQLVLFSERSSIMIAFSNALVEDYVATNAVDVVDTGDEFAVAVPDGKLPLDYIVGFESLGEFEDRILSELGISS